MIKWVCNTIAYGDLMAKDDFGQLDIIDSVKNVGFNIIELRSEFFDGSKHELYDLGKASEAAGLEVFLSVPAPLFVAGILNSELEDFFKLARDVKAKQLKLNLGAYSPETAEADVTLVNNLIDKFGIKLVLENDNTLETGASDYFKGFLEKHGNSQLGMCFDVGNFLYFNEDPIGAAKNVAPLVDYIHLKQVEQATNTSLAGLSVGDVDIPGVLNVLDANLPVAVECQYHADAIEDVEGQMKNDMQNIQAALS